MKAAVAVLVLSLAAGASAAPLEGTHVLPSQTCGGYFLLPMAVGGDPDRVLWMLLDTGASQTVIDVDSAESVAGKPVEPGRHVRFAKLTAGGLTFSPVRAKVMRLDHLQLAIGKPMDGILGFPVFRELLLTLDYPASEVRVRQGSLPRPDGSSILRTVEEKQRPWVDLEFGGEGRPVLIDSGAAGGFVLRDAEQLEFVDDPVVYDSSLRIDRLMMKSGARLRHDVTFGPATLTRPTVQIARSTELVGTQVLRHFVLTFDQKRRRVRLEREDAEPIESPAMKDFGWALRPRPEGLEVVRVFESLGASRAGVLPGDLVVEVEGTPVYERDLCKNEPETRERATVTVQRGADRLEIVVPIDTVVP